eukprot:4895735-Pyramimonas_sp.AAC.1
MLVRHLDTLVEVQVWLDVPASPRSPALLTVQGVKDQMVDIVEPYQTAPTQRILGPLLPPPSYEHLLNQIDGFLEPLGGTTAKYTLQGTTKEEALSLLDTVYDQWNDLAWSEVCRAAGMPIVSGPPAGPDFQWKSAPLKEVFKTTRSCKR